MYKIPNLEASLRFKSHQKIKECASINLLSVNFILCKIYNMQLPFIFANFYLTENYCFYQLTWVNVP